MALLTKRKCKRKQHPVQQQNGNRKAKRGRTTKEPQPVATETGVVTVDRAHVERQAKVQDKINWLFEMLMVELVWGTKEEETSHAKETEENNTRETIRQQLKSYEVDIPGPMDGLLDSAQSQTVLKTWPGDRLQSTQILDVSEALCTSPGVNAHGSAGQWEEGEELVWNV